MAQFNLFDQSFSIPDAYIRDYKMNERSRAAAMNAKNEFYNWYKKRSGIEDVLKNYTDIAVSMVEKYAFSPLFKGVKNNKSKKLFFISCNFCPILREPHFFQ